MIPAKEQEATLTITAAANAAPGLYLPTIVGTATADKQTLVRKAVPVESVVQAFYIKHWVPTKGCVLEVKEGAFYALSSNNPPDKVLEIKQGGSEKVVVKAVTARGGQVSREPGRGAACPAHSSPRGARRLRRRAPACRWPPSRPTRTRPRSRSAFRRSRPSACGRRFILGGTMNTGKESVTRLLPAIAVKVIAAK